MSGTDRLTIGDEHRLDELIQTNPREALALGRTWIDSDDPRTLAVAWSALGRASFELGEIPAAVEAMRRAIRLCADCDDPTLAASTSMSGAAIMAEANSVDEALATIDIVERTTEQDALGRVLAQRAYVLHHAGRLGDALTQLDRAEPVLIRAGDDLGHVRLLVIRGLVQLQQGRTDEAESDLRAADRIATELGQAAMRAGIASNLGVVHGRRRQIREALEEFDRADRLHDAAGKPGRMVAVTQLDRAEVLMHSGMAHDSVAAASAALSAIAGMGNQVMLGDALLLLARAQLAAGDHRSAARTSDEAASQLTRTGRDAMAGHARAVRAHTNLARARTAEESGPLISESVALAAELDAHGWTHESDDLRLACIRSGARLGLSDQIAPEVAILRDRRESVRRDESLLGWYAEAIGRFTAADHREALDACRSGLGLVDEIMDEAPTLERRSAAMRLGSDLSQLAIEVAIDIGEVDAVFGAAEGTRARSLHEELVESDRHRPLSIAVAGRLQREVTDRVGDRVLVEYVVADDAVWAVVIGRSQTRLTRLAGLREIIRARDRMLAWIDRAAAEPDVSSVGAMTAATRLADLVVAPLSLGDASEIVIVPVDALHGIPWSALTGTVPLTLVPSARMWLESDRRSAGPASSVGLVVGPEVECAPAERATLERLHSHVTTAAGAGATAATVRSMFAALDLVHVAAHGQFRSDRPLLSTLWLADGKSTLFETVPERVRSLLVILSSCEGGAQGTRDGSEVLGLASVMLARGAAAVLAPLTVVRDLECAEFVGEVHDELARGTAFGAAVASVRTRWLADDDLSRWAVASSFACFGSGAVTVAVGDEHVAD